MKFYEEHARERELFEILAVHEDGVRTFEELDPLMKAVSERAWEGKPLPFPILLDATGETLRRYSVRAFPTVHLIDPDGNLVRDGSIEMLESMLKEGDPETVDLLAKLKDAKGADARPLLEQLAARPSRPARAALLEYAAGAPKDLREAAYLALGTVRGEESVAFLAGEAGLQSKEAALQDLAIAALARGKDPGAVEPLLAYASNRKARAKSAAAAVAALGEVAPTDERVAKAAVELSRSSVTEVKAAATDLLGLVGGEEAFDRLAHLLAKELSVAVRAKAVAALARTGRADAKALLEKAAAEDKAKSVREAAQKAAESFTAR